MGYNISGFQKGTPEVAPSQGGSPSGIDKNAVQKMALEVSSIQKNIQGWAGKKVVP